MKIKDILAPSDVVLDMTASGKTSLLVELAHRAATALSLSPELVADEIVRRDQLGSTGIGGGVCIPHARLREVAKPFGMLVRLVDPIEFDAIDGQPVDLVFLLILPASSQLDQLNALAAVARKLRDQDAMQKLRVAKTASELFAAVAE